ncbi:MAG: cation transporter, partial [Clostridia bacterium]|nr:cation transporter [Clostridia bacterium]
MERYTVKGLNCAACSAKVEKAVLSVPGVLSCQVSLLTDSMRVEGSARSRDVIQAVKKAGYSASLQTDKPEDVLSANDISVFARRLTLSLCFLLPLLWLTAGKMFFGLPVPHRLDDPWTGGVAQMALAFAVLLVGNRFFVSGIGGIVRRSPNMYT